MIIDSQFHPVKQVLKIYIGVRIIENIENIF